MRTSPHPRIGRRLLGVGLALGLIAAACGSDATDTITLTDGRIEIRGVTGSGVSPTGDTPVDFRYGTLDGDSAAFSDLRGTPVVVNFFASWCPACIAEMPEFESVHQAAGDEVAFLGLAVQDRVDTAAQLVRETGVTYPIGTDDGTIYEMFQGLSMPTTVFIAADGVVRDVHSGQLSADALQAKIDDVLLS